MAMRNITLIACILLSLLSCNRKASVQPNASQNSKLDSTTTRYSNDSTEKGLDSTTQYSNDYTDEEDVEPSDAEQFQRAYAILIASYDKNEIIDSTFIIGADTFHVKVKYACLKNTNVVVPKHFLVPHMDKDFLTHDFVLKLTVLKNGMSHFKRTYEKKYFFKQLQNEVLREYGIILFPYIQRVEENLMLSASISIPLTDVGELVVDTVSLPNLTK